MQHEIKKHVSAIHINNKLTLLQRKLSNVLLLNAYDNLLVNRTHRIDIKMLSLILGYNSRDMDTLKDALRGLVNTTLEWNILNEKGQEKWGISSLLAYGEIEGGICAYEYSAALASRLYNPDIYSNINLGIQRQFTSGYTLALYENCYRFYKPGEKRSTGWWQLETFRVLMGVDDNQYYHQFKELNRKIIKPSIDEINKTSNILIASELKREKRYVTAIRFMLEDNSQFSISPEENEDDRIKNLSVFNRLIEREISERLAIQWIKQHGEEYIAQKMDYTDSQEETGRIKGTPSGFLVSAVTNDYQPPEEQKKKRVRVRRKQESKTRQQEQAQTQEKKQQAKSEQQKVEDYLASLPPAQLEALQAEFLQAHKEDKVLIQQHRKNGFKSAAVCALFRSYARQWMEDSSTGFRPHASMVESKR